MLKELPHIAVESSQLEFTYMCSLPYGSRLHDAMWLITDANCPLTVRTSSKSHRHSNGGIPSFLERVQVTVKVTNYGTALHLNS
jgi:hypothetical protein